MNHGLRIESLTVRIPLLGGSVVHAASDIDLDVPAGTVTALVGESGCGKSIIATSVMNMLPPNASRTGTVTVGTPDLEIDVFSGAAFRGRHVALVPQSAATHLTPVRTARSQLSWDYFESARTPERRSCSSPMTWHPLPAAVSLIDLPSCTHHASWRPVRPQWCSKIRFTITPETFSAPYLPEV